MAVFGRRARRGDDEDTPVGAEIPEPDPVVAHDDADEQAADELKGPFDIDDFDDPAVAELARLDLGSVLIPMPEAGQLQVELTETGVPSAVWVVTANGRFTIAAYAAPKTGGLWREVAAELAESLRNDSAKVSIQDGPWGREVVGTAAGVVRFIGVDGYRWMIRCVVNGTHETMEALSRKRERRWRTPSFAAATPPFRCARRCRCSCPSRWPSSCGRPRPRSRPPRSKPSPSSRRATSRPRGAAPTGRPCNSCAPPPAADSAARDYSSASAARQAAPKAAGSAPI